MGLSSIIVCTFLCSCTFSLRPPIFSSCLICLSHFFHPRFSRVSPFSFPFSFASCTFLASLSAPILKTCRRHRNCPRCVVTFIDSTFRSSLYTSFLILSNLVFIFILLRNLTSVLIISFLYLSFVVYDLHGFTTLLTTSAFTSCEISIVIRNSFSYSLVNFVF